MSWEPWPGIAPERFDRLDRCVVRMADINRRLEQSQSAVRVICSDIE
jgi:hypothetical protein